MIEPTASPQAATEAAADVPHKYMYRFVLEKMDVGFYISVPCMPPQELPCVPGEISVMPMTIEEALARPDHAKWREAL